MKINLTPNFTTMVAGHSKTRAFFHHFKIMKQATCPCNNGDQKKGFKDWELACKQIRVNKMNISKHFSHIQIQ